MSEQNLEPFLWAERRSGASLGEIADAVAELALERVNARLGLSRDDVTKLRDIRHRLGTWLLEDEERFVMSLEKRIAAVFPPPPEPL